MQSRVNAALKRKYPKLISAGGSASSPSKSTPRGRKVSKSKHELLVVGAGGIGCELLKNLVLSGFVNITIVDLDTIDLSNLNRQFFFRRQHISQSKAKIASEAVSQLAPALNIVHYHANIITDPRFDLDFFSKFDLVLNALDNLDARRHVNKMCLACRVPLIESGTAGLLGQVKAHIPGVSECFDCVHHETPKTFPVCTIRSTPSQPIHCIVWAKEYLFAQLYGETDDQSSNGEPSAGEDLEELKKLREEALALKRLRESTDSPDYVRNIFEKVYDQDIQRLLSNEEMWKIREPPRPLSFETLSREHVDDVEAHGAEKDHQIWSVHKSFSVFKKMTETLGKRGKILDFDKDDHEIMQFVTAAASLRSYNFSIEQKSPFQVKQMAGNIIPAIASTNAIIAGLMVLLAFKVLSNDHKTLKNVYLAYNNPMRYLHGEKYSPPNSDCQVCSMAYRSVSLKISSSALKFGDLLQKTQESYGFSEEFSVLKGKSTLLYDPDFDDNTGKSLAQLDLKHGESLTFVDESDEPKVPIVLFLKNDESQEDDNVVFSHVDEEIPMKPAKKPSELESEPAEPNPKKRKLDDDETGSSDAKKTKQQESVIDVEEQGDAIVLD